jgi:hypothetical protein
MGAGFAIFATPVLTTPNLILTVRHRPPTSGNGDLFHLGLPAAVTVRGVTAFASFLHNPSAITGLLYCRSTDFALGWMAVPKLVGNSAGMLPSTYNAQYSSWPCRSGRLSTRY